jgi:hypothetical protein
MWRDDPDEEDAPSGLGELLPDRARRKRNTDGQCDECGATEGSTVTDDEDGWELCRECMNDHEVLEKHING